MANNRMETKARPSCWPSWPHPQPFQSQPDASTVSAAFQCWPSPLAPPNTAGESP